MEFGSLRVEERADAGKPIDCERVVKEGREVLTSQEEAGLVHEEGK